MSDAEVAHLIDVIARKIEERAQMWVMRNNDYADLYATECAAVAKLVRNIALQDVGERRTA